MSSSPQKSASQVDTAFAERQPQQRAVASPESRSSIDVMHVLHGEAGNRAVTQALGAGGPLAPDVLAEMEERFGADFGEVRVHDDTQAHRSATSLAAKAYTYGNDIVFNANRFAPHGREGRRLLAHELAHVVQQRRGGHAPVGNPDAFHERAADNAADTAVRGRAHIDVGGETAVGIARTTDEEQERNRRAERKFRQSQRDATAEQTMPVLPDSSVLDREREAREREERIRKTPQGRGASSKFLGGQAERATPWALAEINRNIFPVAGPGTPIDVSRPTTIFTPTGPMDVEGGIDLYVHSWPTVMAGLVEQKFSDPSGKYPKEVFEKASAIANNLIKNMEHAEEVFDAAERGEDFNATKKHGSPQPLQNGPYTFPPGFRAAHKAALEALQNKQKLPEGFVIILTNTGGTQNKIGKEHVERLLKQFKDPDYVKHLLEHTQIWDTRPGKQEIKNALDDLTLEAKATLTKAEKKKTSAEAKKVKAKASPVPSKKTPSKEIGPKKVNKKSAVSPAGTVPVFGESLENLPEKTPTTPAPQPIEPGGPSEVTMDSEQGGLPPPVGKQDKTGRGGADTGGSQAPAKISVNPPTVHSEQTEGSLGGPSSGKIGDIGKTKGNEPFEMPKNMLEQPGVKARVGMPDVTPVAPVALSPVGDAAAGAAQLLIEVETALQHEAVVRDARRAGSLRTFRWWLQRGVVPPARGVTDRWFRQDESETSLQEILKGAEEGQFQGIEIGPKIAPDQLEIFEKWVKANIHSWDDFYFHFMSNEDGGVQWNGKWQVTSWVWGDWFPANVSKELIEDDRISAFMEPIRLQIFTQTQKEIESRGHNRESIGKLGETKIVGVRRFRKGSGNLYSPVTNELLMYWNQWGEFKPVFYEVAGMAVPEGYTLVSGADLPTYAAIHDVRARAYEQHATPTIGEARFDQVRPFTGWVPINIPVVLVETDSLVDASKR